MKDISTTLAVIGIDLGDKDACYACLAKWPSGRQVVAKWSA